MLGPACCIMSLAAGFYHGVLVNNHEQQQWPTLFWVHLGPPQPGAHKEVSHTLALRFSVDSTWLLKSLLCNIQISS